MQLKLPELGEGVHEGEFMKWRVKVGDVVKDDQVLCEIMTDKATIELPSPFHGKITELNAKEGVIVHVGETLLSYEGAAGSAQASAPSAAPSAPAPTAATKAPAAAPAPAMSAAPAAPARPATPMAAAPSAAPGTWVPSAPSTRRFAREQGLDVNAMQGSGPHGRVMREDVERALGSGATAAGSAKLAPQSQMFRTRGPAPADERMAIRGLRKKIAEKMRLSKDRAAHFTYVEECDATELVKLRAQAKEIGAAQGIKVTYLPFIMKAMVAALRKYPMMNSNIDDEKNELIIKHVYNIGLSIQTEDGLTAPVVKDVASKSVLELAADIQNIVDRARAKKLTNDDFHGGSITLTNAGSIGGLFATPIINYPEVAILGFNKIFRKPAVIEKNGKEEIVIRDWTYFSISLDHRIIDGAIGAEFMKLFIKYIENPSLLILEGGA